MGELKYQYLATFLVNLLGLTWGITCGWPSPNLPILSSIDTPLLSGPLTSDEQSMIAALMCAGGFIGNFLFSWLTERYGRHGPLLIAAIPQIIGFLLILVAENPMHLYISRFMSGVCGGGIFAIVPAYIAEISSDCVRGVLGSSMIFTCNFGILFAFTFGAYLPYSFSPIFVVGICILFLFTFYFMPETPIYLMKKQRFEDAQKSIRFYHDMNLNTKDAQEFVRVEMMKIELTLGIVEGRVKKSKLRCSDFIETAPRKAMTISLVLGALNQFCGVFAMLNYTSTIFEISGSTMSPNASAIVVSVIQIFGSYLSTALVDRAGRKMLLTVSAISTSLGLLCLSGYIYAKSTGYNVDSFNWIPIASFSFVILFASMGVLTLPFLVIAEVLPDKIRSFGTMAAMSLLWIFSFSLIKLFPLMSTAFGMHGSLVLFAICSILGAFFILFFVPETKGKSLEEIMKILS